MSCKFENTSIKILFDLFIGLFQRRVCSENQILWMLKIFIKENEDFWMLTIWLDSNLIVHSSFSGVYPLLNGQQYWFRSALLSSQKPFLLYNKDTPENVLGRL